MNGKHAGLSELRGGSCTRQAYVSREISLPCRFEVQEMRLSRDPGPVVSVPFRPSEPLPALREFSRGEAARRRSHRPHVQESPQLSAEVLGRVSALVPVLPAPVLLSAQEIPDPQA